MGGIGFVGVRLRVLRAWLRGLGVRLRILVFCCFVQYRFVVFGHVLRCVRACSAGRVFGVSVFVCSECVRVFGCVRYCNQMCSESVFVRSEERVFVYMLITHSCV